MPSHYGNEFGPELMEEELESQYSDDVMMRAMDMTANQSGHAPDVPQGWETANPYLVDEGVEPEELPVESADVPGFEKDGLGIMDPESESLNPTDQMKQTLLEDYAMDMDNSVNYQGNAEAMAANERAMGRKLGM